MQELAPATSLGFECIRFAEDILEWTLLPWQRWFLVHALELHPTDVDRNGFPLFRFRKVILLVGRQNGKSTVMQALTLWRLYVDRCSLVIGTAQDLEIAESLWGEVVEVAQEIPELAAEIAPQGGVSKGSGKKALKLRSGETYKVKAASRRGGRGLSGGLVLLDELAQHQSWDAWAAVTKTTNAQERAQIYGISNAGDAASIVLRYLRKMAHQAVGNPDGLDDVEQIDEDLAAELADGDTLGIFEWSAAPGCSVTDRQAWAQANPALGHVMAESTLAGDARTDPEWVFRTEVLCQWSDGSLEGPFPPGTWDDCAVGAESQIVGTVKACVDVSVDRSHAHIAFAGWAESGVPQVELVATSLPLDFVLPWLRDRSDVIDAVTGQTRGAPVSSLLPDLAAAGITVVDWVGQDVTNGTGSFYDLVRTGGLRHTAPNPPLDIAAATAVPKMTDGGAFMWDRKRSATDIAPLIAATGAVWLLMQRPPTPVVSAYETSGLLVV